ncbi:hypothetical protein BHE74_00032809 [Ensete ventricosum]|nr:hypothetical protein BHE74_00032809 [Ensete ventricosum]
MMDRCSDALPIAVQKLATLAQRERGESEFARRFTEGIGKLAGRSPEEDWMTCRKNAKGFGLHPKKIGSGRWRASKMRTRDGRPLLFTIRCSQHYCMVLADRMHNAGRVISVMDNKVEGFQKEITELKVGSRPEAIAATEL